MGDNVSTRVIYCESTVGRRHERYLGPSVQYFCEKKSCSSSDSYDQESGGQCDPPQAGFVAALHVRMITALNVIIDRIVVRTVTEPTALKML